MTQRCLAVGQGQVVNRVDGTDEIEGPGRISATAAALPTCKQRPFSSAFSIAYAEMSMRQRSRAWQQFFEVVQHEPLGAADVQHRGIVGEQ